jgi:hypothetical protein
MNFLPSSFEKFFNKIQVFFIHSVQLKEILVKDLKPFSELTRLYMYNGNLEVLPKNLFAFNTKLKFIDFETNKLKFIALDILKPLTNLVKALFTGNSCIDESANTKSELIALQTKLNKNCFDFKLEILSIDESILKLEDNAIENNINLKDLALRFMNLTDDSGRIISLMNKEIIEIKHNMSTAHTNFTSEIKTLDRLLTVKINETSQKISENFVRIKSLKANFTSLTKENAANNIKTASNAEKIKDVDDELNESLKSLNESLIVKSKETSQNFMRIESLEANYTSLTKLNAANNMKTASNAKKIKDVDENFKEINSSFAKAMVLQKNLIDSLIIKINETSQKTDENFIKIQVANLTHEIGSNFQNTSLNAEKIQEIDKKILAINESFIKEMAVMSQNMENLSDSNETLCKSNIVMWIFVALVVITALLIKTFRRKQYSRNDYIISEINDSTL